MISWTRSDLKWRAKQAFRKNYWSAVLVSLVLAIVLASGGKGAVQSGACNVFEVGGRSFYIENLYAVPGVGKLLSAFRSGYYGNVVKTMFFRDLFTFLWSLLFIIPGIIKSYEYKMVPYLLAEYPDMDRKEVFARSRDMMYGQKWNTFVLDLSFIPWNILSTITFGLVGLFYVSPYQDATYAELYDALAAGMPGNNGQRVYGNGNYYYD